MSYPTDVPISEAEAQERFGEGLSFVLLFRMVTYPTTRRIVIRPSNHNIPLSKVVKAFADFYGPRYTFILTPSDPPSFRSIIRKICEAAQ